MLSSEESNGILLASAARTVDTYSPEMNNNKGFKGVLILFDCTVDDAGASVVPIIQVRDPATNAWVTYLTGTAKDAVAATSWIIYPLYKMTDCLACTDEDEGPLPVIWRLFMDVADANALTYSVGYQYVP